VAGFTLASLLTGFATNEAWLLAARAGQGLFAAIACPTALALIATTFAPGKARNQAFAIFGAMGGLGSVAGLVAGGVLATIDWRLVFWINVPVGIACVVGGYFALEESAAERRHALDVKGAILAVAGCVTGVYALTAGPEEHWKSPAVYAAAAVSVVCLVAFLYVERSAKNPILPFSLFRNRNRVAAMIAILICGALIPTLGFYVALTFQQVLGYTPLQSGLALVPFAVGMGISVAVASKLVVKYQARWLVLMGGIIVFVPCLYVPTLMTKDPAEVTYFPYIALPVFFIGIGVGFAIMSLPLCALAGVRPSEIGPMSALVEVCQNLGGIIGLASVQVVVTSRIMKEGGPTSGELSNDPTVHAEQLKALASGYGLAFISCAAILILAGLVVVPFMRFTPEEVAEGQAAQESSKSGGAIPSTSFPAQALEHDDDDVDDDWEPIEGDVTSGSFPAVNRADFDRAYNEQP
ncbi:MFS transporter, partial [Tsukamurella paurometabola]